MKLSLLAVGALASTTIAAPFRPQHDGEVQIGIVPIPQHDHSDPGPHILSFAPVPQGHRPHHIHPGGRPCHGMKRPYGLTKSIGMGSPFRAVRLWLAEHGLVSPPRPHHHHHHDPKTGEYAVNWFKPPTEAEIQRFEEFTAERPHGHGHRQSPESVQNKIEDMIRNFQKNMAGGVLPIVQGGDVRVVELHRPGHGQEGQGFTLENPPVQPQPHPGHGLHGQGGWHHRRPQSFGGRLQRAANNLRPAESLALAFVLGAGLGSIIHMFFMLSILFMRRIRCRRANPAMLSEGGRGCKRDERRAKRAAKRAERKLKKMERRSGRIRLEGENEGLVGVDVGAGAQEAEGALPPYDASETRIVQDKA